MVIVVGAFQRYHVASGDMELKSFYLLNQISSTMWKCILIILCYCIGIYFLWLNPNDANYKFIFYVCFSIPVVFFCYKIGKENNSLKKMGFIGILFNGIVASLGTLIAYLMLIDFSKEHEICFVFLLLLFIVSIVGLIIWSRKVRK